MKHMKLDDRNRLEFLAACGRSANQIAEDRGRSPSAIRKEFIKHDYVSVKGVDEVFQLFVVSNH